MPQCLKCQKAHNGSYASGKYCSSICAHSRTFSEESKQKKREAQSGRISSIPPEKRREIAKKGALAGRETRKQQFHYRVVNLPFDDLTHREKRYVLQKEQRGRCAQCNINEAWNKLPLRFELDHINGDRKNETRANLQLICPNCHSQTPTYRSKNKLNVTEEQIVEAIRTCQSAHSAMISLGIAPNGSRYTRFRKVAERNGLPMF